MALVRPLHGIQNSQMLYAVFEEAVKWKGTLDRWYDDTEEFMIIYSIGAIDFIVVNLWFVGLQTTTSHATTTQCSSYGLRSREIEHCM